MNLHEPVRSQENFSYGSALYTSCELSLHFHDRYELIYAASGYTKVILGDKEQFLSEGELLLIPPYTVHAVSVDSVSRTWIGVFSEEFISSFSRKYENACFSSFSCDPQIEKMLCKYLFVKNIPEHYMLTSCLYMVCNECEKNADKRELSHGELKRAIVDTIMENVSFDITLGDIADRLGYEYHYLSGLFNECFDMNYKGLVNVLRQDLACRLLQDKNKDIASISEECGFGSVRNFNRVFKKMSGLTPREYRYQK